MPVEIDETQEIVQKFIQNKISTLLKKKIPFSCGQIYTTLKFEKCIFPNLANIEISVKAVKDCLLSHEKLVSSLDSGKWVKSLYKYKFDLYYPKDLDISKYVPQKMVDVNAKAGYSIRKDVLSLINNIDSSNKHFVFYKGLDQIPNIFPDSSDNSIQNKYVIARLKTNRYGHLTISPEQIMKSELNIADIDVVITRSKLQNRWIKKIAFLKKN